MPNFHCMWRYSCVNVTYKKPYKRHEGRTSDVLITFISYVNDLNKLQQFKASVKKSHHGNQRTFHSTFLAIVRVALLRSPWRSCCMRPALFIMQVTNSSLVFTFYLLTSLFIQHHRQKSYLYTQTPNNSIFTHIENWTHVYMKLFTRNSPYYHLLKNIYYSSWNTLYISEEYFTK